MCVRRCKKLCERKALSSKCVVGFHMHGGGIFGKGWISFSYMYTSKNWGGNPIVNDILISKYNNKIVHQTPCRKYHDSRWLFKKTLTIIIFANEGCF
jgi:hypothetical protein